MKVKSVIVEGVDPFRIGLELGQKLKPIQPQIVIVFSSINYAPFDEFIEGIESAFDEQNVPLIIGGTGDGYYESSKVGEVGASAMGINGEGEIEFKAAFGRQSALESLHAKMPNPSFVMCLSDFHADGTAIVENFDQKFQCPLIGGLLGYGRIVEFSYGFVNQNIMKDAFILLGFKIKDTSNLVFDIQSGSGWSEIGEQGKVTSATANKILTINNRPASVFLEEATGNSCKAIDKGVTSFKITEEDGKKSYIRSISNIAENDDPMAVTLYGHVNTGSTIRVCNGDPLIVKEEVLRICKTIKENNIDPELAIVISCTGRKWLLVNAIQFEVSNVFKAFEKNFPLIGFPSYGEFAPLMKTKNSVINGFHNVTYVILVIGKIR